MISMEKFIFNWNLAALWAKNVQCALALFEIKGIYRSYRPFLETNNGAVVQLTLAEEFDFKVISSPTAVHFHECSRD